MIDRPYPIGAVVRGANCNGQPFEAVVVEYRSPLTAVLSDGCVTPVSLIREVVTMPATIPVIAASVELEDDPLAGFEFEDDARGRHAGRV